MTTERCCICGQPVRVVGDETRHYEPAMPEEVRALLWEISGVLEDDDYWDDVIVAMHKVEALYGE